MLTEKIIGSIIMVVLMVVGMPAVVFLQYELMTMPWEEESDE